MKPKSQKIIKVLKWSIQAARKMASNHWKLSNIRETIKNSCEGVATVFHRRFEHHQSRWNAWRCSRLANLPWREVQDMHPLPLTFFRHPSLSLFHRWRFRETPDIPLRLHPTLSHPPCSLCRPGTAGYEYRQLFFTLVEHISTTVGIERLARCSAPHYNPRICRGILDRSFASIGISPLPWWNEHPKGRQTRRDEAKTVWQLKG